VCFCSDSFRSVAVRLTSNAQSRVRFVPSWPSLLPLLCYSQGTTQHLLQVLVSNFTPIGSLVLADNAVIRCPLSYLRQTHATKKLIFVPIRVSPADAANKRPFNLTTTSIRVGIDVANFLQAGRSNSLRPTTASHYGSSQPQ
jgi:hypothetical protein